MQTRERHIWFWATALVVLIAALAMLREILLPFVVGIVLAYFLSPLVDRLQTRGLGRTGAAALVIGLGAFAIVAAVVLLAPLISNQVRQLVQTLPADLERMKVGLDAALHERFGTHYPALQGAVDRALNDLAQSWSGSAATVLSAVWSRGLALINILSLVLITPVVVFYLLVDWHPMLQRIDGWLPREHAVTIRRLADEINAAVAAFIRGQGSIGFLLGIFYAIGLTLCGVPYGLLIGLATGLLSFVPIVGWVVGIVSATAIALIQGWPSPTLALKAIGVLSAGMALDTALLSPRFVGQKVGLHPVWMIFALFAFSYMFGFVGTLVAVPVAAAIGVLVRFALEVYLASGIYQGEPRPAAPHGGASPIRIQP